jgi:hypothetical protein
MVKNHKNKCLPSLDIKEIYIKTTPRFHLTLVRIASIRTPPTTNVGKDVGIKEPSHTAVGNVS